VRAGLTGPAETKKEPSTTYQLSRSWAFRFTSRAEIGPTWTVSECGKYPLPSRPGTLGASALTLSRCLDSAAGKSSITPYSSHHPRFATTRAHS
jgi:hypothetical protein